MRVLFFKAPWCSACHAIEDVVPSDVVHVDCEEQPEVADRYHISGLPVFIAVGDDDAELARIQTTSMPALKQWIRSLQ